MRRFECYLISIVLLCAVLLSGFAVWSQLYVYQSVTKDLIETMDKNSRERENAMERQIQTGLEKSDTIGKETQSIDKNQTQILISQTKILDEIQKLLQSHNAPLKRAAEASEAAEHAAKVSASESRKAVKEVQRKPLIERIFK